MTKINPDSVALQQLDEHWQKIAAFLLWKLAGTAKVSITLADMKAMSEAFEPGMPCVNTHAHFESLDFQLVTEEAAQRLAAHDRTMKGHA